MQWLSALIAILPIAGKLLDLFIKTPEEKREAVLRAFIGFTANVAIAVDKGKETGDFSELEDELNRRIGA